MGARRSLKLPAHLPPDAAPLWRAVVEHLSEAGSLAPVHTGLVETYCLAVLRHRSLSSELASDGRPKPAPGESDPLIRAAEQAAGTVRSMARALGLTATAGRAPTKQQAPKNGVGDVWGKILS
jgi:P27 family predicted phage terminase small subunit